MEEDFIDRTLSGAWQAARQKYGRDPATWNTRAQEAVQQRRMGYGESLDGFPALDRDQALPLPALSRVDGGTIGCQTAQSYTQWVPLHESDLAMSILPIGQSERPGHASRTSTFSRRHERTGASRQSSGWRKTVQEIEASLRPNTEHKA